MEPPQYCMSVSRAYFMISFLSDLKSFCMWHHRNTALPSPFEFGCSESSHAPSIRSHRGTKVIFPDFQPMRVTEEPVCIDLFRQNPVFTSLHLKSPVHVVPPRENWVYKFGHSYGLNQRFTYILCRLRQCFNFSLAFLSIKCVQIVTYLWL